MGQQQILILVLTIVIVSIAVYIGIDLFDRTMRQKHIDLLVNHTVMVASEAIAWKTKGSPFLGGGGSYLELDTDGMNKLLMTENRLPGTVRITRATVSEVDVVAVSDVYPELGVLTQVVGEEIVETSIVYDGSITLPPLPGE
ncbi:MAG: hypothetical protein R3247_05960 [Rhodothermales bacterium]|nr:hypothetical protein [Rhodothermales bacterium]